MDAIVRTCPNPDLVVGHSIGAVLAASYARRVNPTTATMLIGAPVFRSTSDARSRIREFGWLARATMDGSFAARARCQTMCALRPLAMLTAPIVRPDMPAPVAVDAVRHTWNSYRRTLECAIDHRIVDDIGELTGPITALHGSDNRVAPRDQLVDALGGHRHVDVRTIDGADHHLPIREPKHVADAISDLLAARAA